MSKIKILLIIIFFNLPLIDFGLSSISFNVISVSFSQDIFSDRTQYYNFGEKFFAEAHAFPTANGDSVLVLIAFKYSNDIISYTQKNSAGKSYYVGLPEVEVQCKDKEGIIRKRVNWTDTVRLATYDETVSKNDYFMGSIEFALHSGDYNLSIKFVNPNSKKRDDKLYSINSSIFQKDSTNIANPVFLKMADANTFMPYLLNNSISFSSHQPVAIIPFRSNEQEKYSFIARITRSDKSDDKPALTWNVSSDYSASPEIICNTIPKISIDEDNSIKLTIDEQVKVDPSKAFQNCLMKIVIPKNFVAPGLYNLELIKQGGKDTVSFQFNVVWENMPLSLRRADYAVKMMFYIIGDDEFEAMNSGSEREKFSKLMDYWRKQDPTPSTPFNEKMAEYFRRIDYSVFNFQTITEKDGAATDRGKIYILNGKPDKTERKLDTDNTKEVWYYNTLKKQFVFEQVSTGRFKLVQINNI